MVLNAMFCGEQDQIISGCPAVREKSGKFQTLQKSGKSQGILLKVRENEYWEKSGNLYLVQSR